MIGYAPLEDSSGVFVWVARIETVMKKGLVRWWSVH
jgi:hypothetical protein